MKTSFLFKIALLFMSGCVLTSLSGCGGKPETTYDEADYEEATDLFSAPVQEPQVVTPDTVLAVVNGETVTAQRVETEVQNMLAASRRPMPPEQLKQQRPRLIRMALQNIVQRKVLLDESYEMFPEPLTSDVDQAISNIVAGLPKEQTLEGILSERQMTRADLRDNLERELRIRKVIDAVAEGMEKPADTVVRDFYEENQQRFMRPAQVTARHILIQVEEDDDAAAREAKKQKAQDLREQLARGDAEFETLAKEHSDCPSGERGGNLGAFRKGQMVPAFEQAAFTQEIGEIGPVVETRFGYHIIETLARTEEETMGYDAVKTNILQMLTSRNLQGAMESKIEELIGEADVEYHESFAP